MRSRQSRLGKPANVSVLPPASLRTELEARTERERAGTLEVTLLLSDEHFSVDGTLIGERASHKSFKSKNADNEDWSVIVRAVTAQAQSCRDIVTALHRHCP
jgi:hypothetical protein